MSGGTGRLKVPLLDEIWRSLDPNYKSISALLKFSSPHRAIKHKSASKDI